MQTLHSIRDVMIFTRLLRSNLYYFKRLFFYYTLFQTFRTIISFNAYHTDTASFCHSNGTVRKQHFNIFIKEFIPLCISTIYFVNRNGNCFTHSSKRNIDISYSFMKNSLTIDYEALVLYKISYVYHFSK